MENGQLIILRVRHRAAFSPPASLFFIFISLLFASSSLAQLVKSVDAVGMTVSDMDRSIEFFSKVLSFEKIADVEVYGNEYEKLQGLFGLRMRVVRLKL